MWYHMHICMHTYIHTYIHAWIHSLKLVDAISDKSNWCNSVCFQYWMVFTYALQGNPNSHIAMHIRWLFLNATGTRAYAEAIADVIDPEKKYFSARILSRTDVPELGHSLKSIERFFPIDSSMVVVIDDREDVWKGCRNLVTIEPYHFWRNMADVNNSSGEVIGGSRGVLLIIV
jgi:hypothetical protein